MHRAWCPRCRVVQGPEEPDLTLAIRDARKHAMAQGHTTWVTDDATGRILKRVDGGDGHPGTGLYDS